MNYRATSLFFLSIFFVFLAFLFWGEGEEHTDGLYPKNETLTEQFQPSISQEKPDSSFNLSNDSNKVCDELMRNFEAIVHIESKRKKIIEDYFSKILKNGADWQILDLLAVQSGMPVSDIVNYLPKNKSALRQVKNIVLTFDLEFILDENLRRLESLFLNGNYEEIKNTIGIHSKHKLYAGLPLFFYGIQKTEKEHASEMLSTLFAQGVKPTLLDVVWATKYETPSFLTAQLVSNISNSEEIFWEGEGQLQSLSIVLATHFNYQSLELWLNKIDTSNQLKQKGSELDRLPIPSSNEMKRKIERNVKIA